jgi:hypothetical protein
MFQDTEVSEDNFERGPPRDHPNQVWFNMVQWFWWRRFNVVSVQWMRDGWQMTDSKWWQKFTWPLSFESDKLIKSCFPSKVQWIWWTNDRWDSKWWQKFTWLFGSDKLIKSKVPSKENQQLPKMIKQ